MKYYRADAILGQDLSMSQQKQVSFEHAFKIVND